MARRRPEPPLDPFERAARRADPDYARLAEAAEPPRNLRAPRLLLLFAGLVIMVAFLHGGGTASLKKSCTTPGFGLGTTTIDVDATLHWSAAGPAADTVLVALDSPDTVPTEPVAGPVPLKDCLVHGAFPVQAHTGKHTLTLFVLTSDGGVTARISRAITVR